MGTDNLRYLADYDLMKLAGSVKSCRLSLFTYPGSFRLYRSGLDDFELQRVFEGDDVSGVNDVSAIDVDSADRPSCSRKSNLHLTLDLSCSASR